MTDLESDIFFFLTVNKVKIINMAVQSPHFMPNASFIYNFENLKEMYANFTSFIRIIDPESTSITKGVL